MFSWALSAHLVHFWLLVSGCGARAVSRKTPFNFISRRNSGVKEENKLFGTKERANGPPTVLQEVVIWIADLKYQICYPVQKFAKNQN